METSNFIVKLQSKDATITNRRIQHDNNSQLILYLQLKKKFESNICSPKSQLRSMAVKTFSSKLQ